MRFAFGKLEDGGWMEPAAGLGLALLTFVVLSCCRSAMTLSAFISSSCSFSDLRYRLF